ncbi:hypothetical protein E1B28_013182 [Marasmius oreades]|uniref:DUF6534 domain-containing protein n=1 Tax=Marasmius oreades TaxID=181124 RepID=A0A9P7RQ22_9AGAR|nr:uncharacterized protein E1B28_013182 [Marasmius oreades]KAG7087201.1 hypothetical protein E1B28_013182 [Marasmius oreades]
MSAPPVIPNLEPITAPLFLGSMFNWGLWGILACQTYLYRMYFPKDKLVFKALIYVTFLLETIQTALSTYDNYMWFVRGFGDPSVLDKTFISPFDAPMMGAIIALFVQLFYVYRIYLLNNSWAWFCVLIIIITVAQTVGAFIGGIRGLKAGVFSIVATGSMNVVAAYLWLVGAAVADVMIAGAMFFSLIYTRRSNFRTSQDILLKAVILIIESNTLTAGIAVLSLIMFVGFPKQTWFTCPSLVLGKVYANSLMVSFNNRIVFRNLMPTEITSTTQNNLTFNHPSSDVPLSPLNTPTSRSKFNTGRYTLDSQETMAFNINPLDSVSAPGGKGQYV